jgi:hypothetical protein
MFSMEDHQFIFRRAITEITAAQQQTSLNVSDYQTSTECLIPLLSGISDMLKA